MTQPLTDAEARRLLDDADVGPALQLGLSEAKEVQAACLAGGVPAVLGKDDHCTKGCSPKVLVLIRQDDVDAVRAILSHKWRAMVDSVGEIDPSYVGVGIEATEDGDPPCPACGHQGPLSAGACAECGLQLG
jgi:hypothetical protein